MCKTGERTPSFFYRENIILWYESNALLFAEDALYFDGVTRLLLKYSHFGHRRSLSFNRDETTVIPLRKEKTLGCLFLIEESLFLPELCLLLEDERNRRNWNTQCPLILQNTGSLYEPTLYLLRGATTRRHDWTRRPLVATFETRRNVVDSHSFPSLLLFFIPRLTSGRFGGLLIIGGKPQVVNHNKGMIILLSSLILLIPSNSITSVSTWVFLRPQILQ